ncbi:MAG: multidrug effflux MFS transporter [Gammaproteobacteria bacterium]|nr:multidrug effflux MFS transporter [Gammaproteobacteria bacterium]MCW5584110.1 multidrug effflux MFS transporter [Gammaproteobacteria bacterium]
MNNKNITFELLLISTWFLGVMAIKFILPSLPSMAEQLHTTPTMAKYTISLFLFGKAAGMLVFGPLSEKYGRRIFMLMGLALFSLGNVFAFFSTSISFLLFARLIQGLGVSATVMVGRAMINDSYKHNKAAVVFSHVFLAASIIIAFLPMIGSMIAIHYQWQAAFIVMAAYSMLILFLCTFFLKETHIPQVDMKLKIGQIILYYKMIAGHPVFLGYVLCSIFMIAGESAFNTASSFLLLKAFGISKYRFGILITGLAVGHLVGTLICGCLVKKYNLVNMMGTGVIILAVSTSVMALLISLGYINIAVIIVPMIIFYIGTGFIMTITAVGAVIPFPKLIGISSSASLSLNFSFSALSSAIMSYLSTTTAGPVSLLIAFCGIAALLSWYLLIVPNRTVSMKPAEAWD